VTPGEAGDSGRIHGWWQTRAPRERLMLGVMAAAIAAFALWLGVLRPLQAWTDAARERHARAAVDLDHVEAAVRDIHAAEKERPAQPAGDEFRRAILDAAASVQVPVARQRTDGAALVVGIDAVTAPALFSWLDHLRAAHGLAPASLEIDKRNGALRVEAAFRPTAQ
jgi:general secretion pathway protein M